MRLACIKINLSFILENPKSKGGIKIQMGKTNKEMAAILNIADYSYLNRLT